MSHVKWLPDQEKFLEERDLQELDLQTSQIVQFFKGKRVLVTGATGFLGKLLVEKLLRACPDIETIYVLVRPKKGEDEHTRADKLFSDVVFSPLKKRQPKFQHKISVFRGDIMLPNLDLSASDRQEIVDQVDIIFHIAATVRFDEKLNTAIAINVLGTRDLLVIAKECKKLQAFLHVSTAYANCNRMEIDERFYESPLTTSEALELMDKSNEKRILDHTDEILGPWPNTYAFTKALAERVVKDFEGMFPMAMFRPAIVLATYREPLKGWIDNIYGPTGVVVGVGTGILKTLHCKGGVVADMVPADYVINAMIAATYKTAVERPKEVPVYNYVSSVENRITWNDLRTAGYQCGEYVPTIRAVTPPSLTLNRYKSMHMLYVLLLHFLPAIIVDTFMVVMGKKPFLVNVYKKVHKFSNVLAYFCTQEWKFHNDNVQALWKELPGADRRVFPFSMGDFSWEEFHFNHLLGLRVYIVKDDLSTLPQARIRMQRLKVLQKVFMLAVCALIGWMIYVSICSVSKILFH